MAASPAPPMRIRRDAASDDELFEIGAAAWSAAQMHRLELSPTPLGMVAEVSPYLARVTGHGELRAAEFRALHNGSSMTIQLGWDDPTSDAELSDLDDFVDAAAVMFPLVAGANLLTMGDAQQPVNMWYWKADQSGPFDVIARGYATSQRRPATASGLRAQASHASKGWQLVLQRSLSPLADDQVELQPGAAIDLGFALWQGSNKERAGQKSVTPVFLPARLDP